MKTFLIGRLAIAAITCVSTHAGAATLIGNGGFESAQIPPDRGLVEYLAGDSGLPGWTITGGSVETVSQWTPFEGHQSLDLDGISPGTIQQSFATTPGMHYTLSFSYSNNPFAGTGATLPASAFVSVQGAGNVPLLGQTITHDTSDPAQMSYSNFQMEFVADSTSATLIFASLDPSNSVGGIALDGISVSAVPELSSFSTLSVGILLGAFGLHRRRDRGPAEGR
jgi:choice-of-anchor C domain-containing protein